MSDWSSLTQQQVSEKLAKYKSDKRLQGFLRHKARSEFMNMKKEVRLLQMGQQPSIQSRQRLKVNNLLHPKFRQNFQRADFLDIQIIFF